MMTAIYDRVLADARDRPAWLKKREGRVGASDAASFSKEESFPLYMKAKLDDSFKGNAYTEHGNDRERAILRAYNLEQNTLLFHAPENDRHVATPDAIKIGADGEIILAQVKTTSKPILKISPAYSRQMWWEQYVMGATRTLFIWEHHEGFAPLEMEPESQWFERDDAQIEKLIRIANRVLVGLDEAAQFRKELQQ